MQSKSKNNKSDKSEVKPASQSVNKLKHTVIGVVVGVVISLCVILILFGVGNIYYADKIYFGVKIGDIDFSGKTKSESEKLLSVLAEAQKNNKIVLKTEEGRSWTIAPADVGFSPNVQETTAVLYSLGRGKNIFINISQMFQLLFQMGDGDIAFSVNEGKIESIINNIKADIDKPEQDATLAIEGNSINIIGEKSGVRLNSGKALSEINNSFKKLKNKIINLEVDTIEPLVYSEGVLEAKEMVEIAIASNIKLSYKNQDFTLDSDKISKWLEFSASTRKVPQGKGNYLEFGMSQGKLQGYIKTIAGALDKEAVDAKLKIENGRAVVFQPSADGVKVEQDKLLNQLNVALTQGGEQSLVVPVIVSAPEVSSSKINDLGINEMIGEATTSFAKSPDNRIHNIQNGAQFLNGQLIKPGDTFSVIQSLGAINDTTGYLPELVIKENKTVPEFGGGLCQVSTTLFRAALSAGLPIVERQNHSWRISYYEPPVGLDATIYFPKPDLKIKNDTSGWILIQNNVDTTAKKITFQFYGTKDGRTAKVIGPTLLYSTPAPEAIYTDDPGLPTGQEKRIQAPHPGGKATATYQVFDKNGKLVNEQKFISVYKASAAQYLRGTGSAPEVPAQ